MGQPKWKTLFIFMVHCDTTRKSFFRECKLGKEKAKREHVDLRQEALFTYNLPLRLDLMYSIQFSGARLNFYRWVFELIKTQDLLSLASSLLIWKEVVESQFIKGSTALYPLSVKRMENSQPATPDASLLSKKLPSSKYITQNSSVGKT